MTRKRLACDTRTFDQIMIDAVHDRIASANMKCIDFLLIDRYQGLAPFSNDVAWSGCSIYLR